jgi:hypothetical protein
MERTYVYLHLTRHLTWQPHHHQQQRQPHHVRTFSSGRSLIHLAPISFMVSGGDRLEEEEEGVGEEEREAEV